MTLRVAGIGASAGGLEAVTELLGALPPRTDLVCIVVQHLDPHHESLLPEILAKKTMVPVAVAVEAAVLQPDHVYIIPPNATLTVADGRFHLTRRAAFQRHLPVDALFASLAAEYAEDAIGIVLSGGDSDGSLGIQAIKHEGGIVFAQEPDSARFPSMPRHAIETGCVDLVLSPAKIAEELGRLSRHPSRRHTAREPLSAPAPEAGTRPDDELLKVIFQRLRAAHGVDFTHYKRSTLRRRLERRMTLLRIDNLEEYVTLLEGNPGEIAALHQDFLIRVTEFFRDPGSFEAMRRLILPALRENRDARRPIRIWVPGCATGEEVYSVAIELKEFIGGGRISTADVQIFGTDVSEVALEKARAGIYMPNVMRDVSTGRLQRFFEQHDETYRISKEIRDLCIFARQDVTRDPPFSRLDLISCRNLLIYLDDVAQHRMLQAFHFALRPNGTLILGPAESVGQSSELFEQVDKRYRMYRRRPGSGHGTAGMRVPASQLSAADLPAADLLVQAEAESLPREADRWLLARFAPASLLVDDALNIQQFRGRTGLFLEPVSGPPSHDLRRVVRPELLVEMLPAIRQARETGLSVRRDALHLDDERDVSIEIVPLAAPADARCFLILLDDGSHPARGLRPPTSLGTLPESEKDRRLVQMQQEIEAMRDYLRAAVEEHGAIQEELKSAHEEMLSANEEYQSTNEELETSKEELQSTNEELTTTNEELRNRNRDLGVLNAELQQARLVSERALAFADILVETVRTPLAVIDEQHRITRVNRAFITDMEIRPESVEGLSIYEVGGGAWNVPELRQRVDAVMRDGQPMDDWEVTLDLPHRGRRIVVLNARRIPARGHLVLLAIDDVTDRAGVTAGLVANSQRKDEFLAMLAHELRHPLTPITHAIHLLRRAEVDRPTAALYDTLDTETQRLVRFVGELQDVVRIGRGLLEIKRERLDLVEVAQHAAESIRPLIERRGHRLTLAIPDGPIWLDGDSARLNQAVSNLLENAAKYTKPGGQIALTLDMHADEAVLSLRDNGVGIPQKDLRRIFEPFTQAGNVVNRSGGGLGLGLSVVRRVLELHGGVIEAHSGGPDMGSEFVVRLPTLAVDGERDMQATGPANATGPAAATRARRVLIVDDRDEVTASLMRLIGAWGHEVAAAPDADVALALAETFQPDSAILDLGLAGANGYDLARQLRDAAPGRRLLLIAYTGRGDANTREQCRAAGFDACIVKPGELDTLQALLRSE